MADEKEEKIAQEFVPYIYENGGEYKGTGRWDKFKSRLLKVRADGIFECYEKKKCKIKIHLLKEPWGDLKQVSDQDKGKGKGKGKGKSCWEFQYGDKTYNFASPNDNERASIMKEFKTFYDKQQSMNKSIDSSGKYNRKKPNNDDFKEVKLIFHYSTSSKAMLNQRSKDAAKHLSSFKKDPYWKRDLYLLKEKHGVLDVDLFEKIVSEFVPYIYENEGEYKGTGIWDKFKPRSLKVRADGLFECYEKKKCKIKIHLLKEQWSDLKQAKGKGKSCWKFKYDGKTYNFASPNDNERASIMKAFKTFYDEQKSMNIAISSGKYHNRDVPNEDDYKEVTLIFYYSTSLKYSDAKKNDFSPKDKKQRNKDASRYLKAFKKEKDPYWKRDLYLLKEKHGVLDVDLFEKKEQEDEERQKRAAKMKKIAAATVAVIATPVVVVGAVVAAPAIAAAATAAAPIAAAAATGVAVTGTVHQAATNPDGKITKMAESVPVLGYVASATHGVKGDKDRAKRAAAKCTSSTVKTTIAVGTGVAIVAAAPASATIVFVGAAAACGGAAGATGGAIGLLAESQIAKGIEDESIKNQCKKGTAKEYAKAIAGGAVKGAVGGAMAGGAVDVVADQVDVVGDVVKGVKEIKETINGGPEVELKGMDKFQADMTNEVTGGANGVCKEMYNERKKEWEYDPQQMDNIYIMTGQGMKYICCDKSGKINCERGKNGTRFESIPHKTDSSKVALKSNGYYLCIDEKTNKVTTCKNIYYFKISSQSNSKFSFVSPNGYYLFFKKKGGFSKGYTIATKLKKDIKLAEIKFFVSNVSK